MKQLAKLFIDDKEYPLLDCDFSFNQPINTHNNKPSGNVNIGLVYIRFIMPKEDTITRWIHYPTMQKDGEIVFYPANGLSAPIRLKFGNAYGNSIKGYFNAHNNEPTSITLQISAGIISLNDVIFETNWNPSNPFAEQTPVAVSEETEVQESIIKEAFWVAEDGSQLTQSKGLNTDVFYGEKVKLKIITQHTPDGEDVEITVKAKTKDGYVKLTDSKGTLQQTLTIRGNEAISEPIYLDPNWYNEEIENYNYTAHQTEIKPDEALTFVIDAKLDSGDQKESLPADDTLKLKPITYRRNYEELIGLFNTDKSKEKDKEKNYENKFIAGNSQINTIVKEFITEVTKEKTTISGIQKLVEKKAEKLWSAAIKKAKFGKHDDRPLYWARNKMQTWLKRNPLFKDQINFDTSVVKKGKELDTIITLFEEKSRNYTGIDFSKAGKKKKVLITGFDPFQLDFNFIQYGLGPSTFNPSGASVLSLANGFKDYYIQTCIFPVRYEDFDKGFVENVIKSNINNVDLIMTTSLNGGDPKFDIERYAAKYRGGGTDNMFIGQSNRGGNESLFKQLNSGHDNYETTLPYKRLFKGKNEVKIEGHIIRFDESISSKKGSGGSYLSNEIMYRSTRLRDKMKLDKPVGHFHLGNLKNIKNNTTVISVIKSVIKKMI